MDLDLTDRQHELIDAFGTLTRERFAPRADRLDLESSFPHANFDDLREAGLMGLCIPEQDGGLGVGIHTEPLTWFLILEEMAKGCASTSQTFQLLGHCVTFLAELGTDEQRERIYPQVLNERALLCSAGAEPAGYTTGTTRAQRATVARRVDGGFVINGRKHFNSLSGEARYYLVHTRIEEADDQSTVLMLVENTNPGLRQIRDWDALGMRGTATNSEQYVDCFVPDADVLGKPGDHSRSTMPSVFFVAFAANYLGAAEGAFEWTVRYVRDEVGSADDPIVQRHVGEMEAQLQAARLTIIQAGVLADRWMRSGHRPEHREPAFLAAHRAKVVCADTALSVTSRCVQISGGRATLSRQPLGRFLRDVRTYTVAPPTTDRSLQTMGQARFESDRA